MKVNLEGLFANVLADMKPRQRAYHKVCLDEVLGHIKDVVAGKHTIEEFAEHYCLAALPDTEGKK